MWEQLLTRHGAHHVRSATQGHFVAIVSFDRVPVYACGMGFECHMPLQLRRDAEAQRHVQALTHTHTRTQEHCDESETCENLRLPKLMVGSVIGRTV